MKAEPQEVIWPSNTFELRYISFEHIVTTVALPHEEFGPEMDNLPNIMDAKNKGIAIGI